MAAPSALALKLGGFLLAHACWIISGFQEGDAYVPQALCEKDGSRELFVFEAETQAEAIAQGKQFLAEHSSGFDRCAFVRDGLIRTEEGPLDVLSLDIVEGELSPKLTVVQPYGRAHSGALQLFGDELLLTEGEPVSPSEASEFREALRSGAMEHHGAAALWRQIDTGRGAAPPLR
jgi:hypothetical protein